MGDKQLLDTALSKGQGVFRLTPTWVPRSFCIPGRRLKLHPDDYYAFGPHRGGIDERWFASTTKADNGPLTTADEGLSYIHVEDGAKSARVLLKDALELMGAEILSPEILKKHGGWVMYSKFFDNQEPLPLHIHHSDATAAAVGQRGKPEAYYFPPQLNNHGGWFPYTFFGLNPGTTREQVKRCLADWEKKDSGILYLSRAYKLQPGTGWDVPPGILHAPGSLLTYEPQRASDVFAMFQNIVWEAYTPRELLTKNVPEKSKNDLDYLLGLLDWELNVDPDFFAHRFMPPKPVKPVQEMHAEGYEERWIVYNSDYFSAKELAILPGRSALIRDEGPYGAIVVQGHGSFGALEVEAPTLIRFAQMTRDEVFVTARAAGEGVRISNPSASESLVLLKHFGPRAGSAAK
jgi:mannose-6-phosphate isomerase class I